MFTYAASKSSYLSILGTFFFLCLAESMLVVFLVIHFVPGVLLQTVVLATIGLLLASIFGRLLWPVWTHHRVSGTTLDLRYGLDFRASLPLSALVSAQPIQEKMGPIPTPRYDAMKKRLSLAFSEHGQVLLRLDQPRTFRLGLRRACLADQLLISLDQRDAFLAALDLAQRTQPASAQSSAGFGAIITPREAVMRLQSTHNNLPRIADDAPVALRTEHLTRRYADFAAVEDLNLAIRSGEIYGFLGPNGAGKSTTIKMLVGLLQPTAGRAWLAEHDVWRTPLQAKGALGYVADHALLYDRLSGREFLAFLAQLRGLPLDLAETRIAELLALLDLSDQAGRPCGSYSFGMKRKLALAGALLHQPPVLILDEPLNGLDPLSARRLKDLFLRLSEQGTTIFLSTHDLATAESICHRVGIIQRGRLLAEGSAAELRELASAPDLESVFLALTTPAEEVTV
jgi:ABC-2 type transport system ATP-binding protein